MVDPLLAEERFEGPFTAAAQRWARISSCDPPESPQNALSGIPGGPSFEARGSGVDRGGLQVGTAQGGGDSRDAKAAVPEALCTCLGLLDAGVGHGLGNLSMVGRPRLGP